MLRNFTSFFLVLALSSVAVRAQIAFENANVIPMTDDQVREGWTVLVAGDRIEAVGPNVDIPAGTERIDASGKYIIPGLAELHGHIPSMEASREYIDDVLFMFVANGITTVRGMQGGQGQLQLREEANSGQIVSPSLYLAGPAFSGGSIDSPDQAVQRVRDQVEEGWDYLKVLPGLTVDEYDAMARTAVEEGIPFVGHIPSDVGLVHAIEMGQQTIDHVDGYIQYLDGDEAALDSDRVEEAVRLTRESGVWIVPTMALWETIMGVNEVESMETYAELAYMPENMVESWIESHTGRRADSDFDQSTVNLIAENRIRILQALNDGGVRILMGTDAPQQFSVPGFSLQRELPLMVAARMTPYEILVSGTRAVGEYFRDKDRFGTIEPGTRADLILLDANPLENIMNVFDRSGVMVRGRWIPENEIRSRLEAIAAGS